MPFLAALSNYFCTLEVCMPRMLCLDLDGTLLMPDLAIPQPVIDALQTLVRRGVVVTLATGRMFPSLKNTRI